MSQWRGKTLIIGAGAHVVYNFPTSSDLKKIAQYLLKLSKKSHINDFSPVSSLSYEDLSSCYSGVRSYLKDLYLEGGTAARAYKDTFNDLFINGLPRAPNSTQDPSNYVAVKYPEKVIEEFFKYFIYSQEPTIDTFVTRQPKWKLLAQLFVTSVLSKCGRKDPLAHLDHDWIQELLYDMPKSVFDSEDGLKNWLPNFITFNYDNLLEKFIENKLVYGHLLEVSQAKRLVKSLGIIHVYGHLEDEYEPDQKKDLISQNFNKINFISRLEDESDINAVTTYKEQLQRILECTDAVCFLGFSYDKNNLNYLFSQKATGIKEANLKNGLEYFGSNYNLGVDIVNQNIEYFGKEHKFQHSQILTVIKEFKKLSL